MPWKRVTRELEQGRALGSYSWAPSDARREKFLISAPIFYSAAAFFSLKPDLESFGDVREIGRSGRKATLCMPHGWTRSTQVRELEREGALEVISPETLLSCFELLLARRVDFVDVDMMAGWHALYEFQAGRGKPASNLPKVYMKQPIKGYGGSSNILFSPTPEGEQALSDYARGLSIIAGNGVLDTILDRHLSRYPEIDKDVLNTLFRQAAGLSKP